MKKQKKLKVEIGNHSDVGQVRKINQDHFGSASNKFGDLYVVADGMGGHQGGEIASQMAVNSLCKSFKDSFNNNPFQFLKKGIMEANDLVLAKAEEDPTLKGMGTTVVAVIIYNGDAYYAHVGDSRIYLFRQNKSKQLTKDHSFVQQMVDEGIITEQEAEKHPEKNRILQAVGIENITPEFSTEKLYSGDSLLLCSDGLTGLVNDGEILKKIGKYSAMDASKELVKLANNRGGHDNITTIVIKVKKGPKPPRPPRPPKHPKHPKPKREFSPVMEMNSLKKAAAVFVAGVVFGMLLLLAAENVSNRLKAWWHDDKVEKTVNENIEPNPDTSADTQKDSVKSKSNSHEQPSIGPLEKKTTGDRENKEKEKNDKGTKEN